MSSEMDAWLKRQNVITITHAPGPLTQKQALVWHHIQTHGRITTAEACKLIGRNIYANVSDYVGATLSRMVKRGYLVREKPGVFVAAKRAREGGVS